jgi:hypothetical protein
MPRGVYDRKPKEPDMSPPNEADTTAEKLFPVVLRKNHAPKGNYEIIGYLKPKVERKDAAGRMITVEPEEFIEGEQHPAPYPGTGFPDKIWAGTHIRLPFEEAKMVVAKKIADRADAIAA